MSSNFKISDYVGVTPRFLRSVNLFNDWKRSDSFAGYIITPNVVEAFEQLNNGLLQKNGQRAFTLIGPYGTGKSAFAVFLCQLLAQLNAGHSDAISLLADSYPKLAKQIEKINKDKGGKGFLPIAVTARRRPIAQILLEGIGQAILELTETVPVRELTSRIQLAIDRDDWRDTANIIQFIDEMGTEAKAQGYSGQLLIIDEAGKTLEYALQDKEGGDVFVFQEIAEYANRREDCPLLFLITLHQMFDDYVELAERTVRAEWTKVQERFQAIQFAESAATSMHMLSEAIRPQKALPTKINTAIDEALRLLKASGAPLPIGLDAATFDKIARRAWPLHPTVLLAMPHLFRRLAQNERSIFSYLTSHEPFGLQEHLGKQLDEDAGFVRLHDLYTYLLANFEAGLARLPQAKRLLEANDVINSRHNLSIQDFNLIRTVAILNVLGDMCQLRATANLLACAASPVPEIKAELEKLKSQSILTYRQLDGSYRVWEGSDVDIDARMKEARRNLKMDGGSILETLRRHLPQRTLVARRHSLETGALRFFSTTYVERLEKPEYYKNYKIAEGASGSVLILLSYSDAHAMRSAAERITQAQPRLIIALPRQIESLRAVVEEVACLKWVEEHTEELRDDRVARRELSLRLIEGEQRIFQLLQALLDPRPAPFGNLCQWFWDGLDQGPKSPVEVTQLLSRACDSVYTQSPRVRNELISRTKISSAVSSARRCLLEKMLTSSDQERLGIEKFPPERSIYESVLHASGLHAFDPSVGTWGYQVPPEDNIVNLKPCWDLLEQEIFSADAKRAELKDIFALLAEAPYGLPEGVHPILFTAFYLHNQDDLFLYRENSFIPDPQPAHFELLQRRPDLFSVAGARLEGIRRTVVERLAKGLNTPVKTASVVRSLFRVINNLPPITMKSSKFERPIVVKFREKLQHARSPEELLFSELPSCFGMRPFLGAENSKSDIDNFFLNLNQCLSTLAGHAIKTQNDARDVLLSKCQISAGLDGWHELERRAVLMGPRVSHDILNPFLVSITNGITDKHNSKPALSYIANRSFDQWADIDIDRFPGLADGIGDIFKKAWANFGDSEPELSEAELRQKRKVRRALDSQMLSIQGKASVNALCAALRELLQELEHASDEGIK